MNKFVFKPYNPLFSILFAKEKQRLSFYFVNIEHVGSTAIVGLGGKGIIDIAIAVNQDLMEEAKSKLIELGYEFRPSFSTHDRYYFIAYLPDPEEKTRRYHIHLTYPTSKPWQELLGFRDYLNRNKQALEEYSSLKEQAVLIAQGDGDKYRAYKEAFIQKIIRALE